MHKHQRILASTLCKFLQKSTIADAVLAVPKAVGGTGSPKSSEFSLLLGKCLMSTLCTFDNEALAYCFLPLAWLCNAETRIIEMSKFVLQRKQQASWAFLVLLIQLLKAGSESHLLWNDNNECFLFLLMVF